MKLGIYCCSNGYGHFHRTIQVVENLEELDVTIHCNEYQYKRFLDKLPNANIYFILIRILDGIQLSKKITLIIKSIKKMLKKI